SGGASRGNPAAPASTGAVRAQREPETAGRPHAGSSSRRQLGQIALAAQRVEAPDQQAGINGERQRQSYPYSDRAPARPEGKGVAGREADAPEAYTREQQRYARVVEAAQRTVG